MVTRIRRWLLVAIFVLFMVVLWLNQSERPLAVVQAFTRSGPYQNKYDWRHVVKRHPVEQLLELPSGSMELAPKIQHDFPPETAEQKSLRSERSLAVKEAFVHSWTGYRKRAWLQDEVMPVTGRYKNGFGGWGATLVDSLDTLWIMGLKKEFEEAVFSLRKIDFSRSHLQKLSVFESTIRYLGGFLSAYDLSDHQYPILLQKAVDLGNMLYVAFDTPNGIPIAHWDWQNGLLGRDQSAPRVQYLADIGSLTLEFTRLSQLTGDNRWYDAATRVMQSFSSQQNKTRVPGLWPTLVDTERVDFTHGNTFTFGGLADSAYEYLPKQHLLLGRSGSPNYESMYLTAYSAAREKIFFRVLNPENQPLLVSGTYERRSALHASLKPEGQHLTCFVGGMVALAAKAFNRPKHLEVARQLVDGCVWAYKSMPSGIMPEIYEMSTCDEDDCVWSDRKWYEAVLKRHGSTAEDNSDPAAEALKIIKARNLPPGFTDVSDPRYQLRPEAIESVFVMYRITGDETLRDTAWDMFNSIVNATRTPIAYAGLKDVTTRKNGKSQLIDTMESFWTAETLKYFYLIFSEPSVVSLDAYVFNTEAHPFRRPKQNIVQAHYTAIL